MAVEVIFGDAEVNLFNAPGPNHQTYRGDDRWLTSVEAYDSAIYCSRDCAVNDLIDNGFSPEQDSDTPMVFWRRDKNDIYSDATLYSGDGHDTDVRGRLTCEFCDEAVHDDGTQHEDHERGD